MGIPPVLTGLERVLREPDLLARGGRLGLVYNQSSVDTLFSPAAELIDKAFPGRLRVLFGPQHGVAMTEQDNMKETPHTIHPSLGIPVYSLYAEARKPSQDMLGPADTVLVDLQDVGTRVYTFATTVLHLMEVAADAGKAVCVLDRPNPINGRDVEGNLLNPDYSSFVGPYPIPMRHGMTMGELMLLYNDLLQIGCRLTVVPMAGWQRGWYFEETGLPWVLPSPNMPLVETGVVYPGQVILEGTNLSEGRGTTRPFELFGAPYLEPEAVTATMEAGVLEGSILRDTFFRPAFNKWADSVCRGFQIHVTDRRLYRPYRLTLGLLSALLKLYPDDFRWSDPPYEYVYDKLPVDVILGDAAVRTDLEQGRSIADMERQWQTELGEFEEVRSRFLLY
ncbi:MAG: DUF1343 domain-containing protein [Desulfomonile tiedjei]|nr:DUF1343 domain-containing protein [Desulfomonile tiedjei]